MTHSEIAYLLGEKTELDRMLAETPETAVLDRASLRSRLAVVANAITKLGAPTRTPARVRLTFKGKPVIGNHGIFAEFGTKAVNGFAESVTAMAASLSAPLAAMGPIPGRDQHQLLITSTALGSFGFELEEHLPPHLSLDEETTVAQALLQTQRVLRGTQGTDDELADSAFEADRRALDKVRAFLQTLADNEATCTVEYGESIVRFTDVGQVRTSVERLSQEYLREEGEELEGTLQGVLPTGRVFEFKVANTKQTIRGKVAPTIADPASLNLLLKLHVRIKVMVTRVGVGRPRYVLVESPKVVESA
jgi:hypothetical protein